MDSTQPGARTLPLSFASLHKAGLSAVLLILAAACDAAAPAADRTAAAPTASAPARTSSCPATDIAGFVAAFAESPSLQKTFTAPMVDTAFVDWSAQPEPAESVETVSRDLLRFPVMPDRAKQRADGLQYREIGSDGDRTTIALEVPDTDLQLRYTFRRDGCWTLVKIVDPALGKAFAGDTSAAEAPDSGTPSSTNGGNPDVLGLSDAFAERMTRAGSQDATRSECLAAERDHQDARLNDV